MKRILLLTFLALLFLLLLGYFFHPFRNNNAQELVLYGNIDIRQVDLGFRVSGRVENLLVDEGDIVTEGMLLASLDKIPFEERVDEAEANLAQTQAALDNATILYERRKILRTTHAVSQEDVDDALSNQKIAQAEYDAALANLASAQTNLEDTQILSPTEGWVLTRIREPGSIANDGAPVLTVSIKSPVWVRAYVDEPNLGRIYPGMQGDIFTDTPGGKVYHGHIGFISPVAEFTPKTVETTQLRTDLVYRFRLVVYDPDRGLRQGMPVTIRLPLSQQQPVESDASPDDLHL